jgi:hypothetical protein
MVPVPKLKQLCYCYTLNDRLQDYAMRANIHPTSSFLAGLSARLITQRYLELL